MREALDIHTYTSQVGVAQLSTKVNKVILRPINWRKSKWCSTSSRDLTSEWFGLDESEFLLS